VVAQSWLEEYAAADVGVKGIGAKGAAQQYVPGRRAWVKVRIRNTREATVGAVIGPIERPERLVLGLHTQAGELRVAWHLAQKAVIFIDPKRRRATVWPSTS
jgi:hypothetical protein